MDLTEKLQEVFNTLDRNQTNLIKFSELGKALRAAGLIPTESQLEEFNRTAVLINGRSIDFNEFSKIASQCKQVSSLNKEEVSDYFNSYTQEKEEFISLDELKKALCRTGDKLGDKEVERLFKDFDRDGSGKINIRELAEGLLEI